MKALNWVTSGGLNPKMVSVDSIKSLETLLQTASQNTKPLVVNFQGVVDVQERVGEIIRPHLQNQKNSLIVLNCSRLLTRLKAEFGRTKRILDEDSYDCAVFGGTQFEFKDLKGFYDNAAELENKTVRNYVNLSFRPFDHEKRLHSTPLLASGVFNARSIISSREQFIWTTLLMAEHLERSLEVMETEFASKGSSGGVPSRILAVSLRASPIAAAISLVSSRELPVEIVDHMGPKHVIMEEHSLAGGAQGIQYVYVGDFLIGGTELKTAQMYAISKGCRVGCALVLGHWLPIQDYKDNLGPHLTFTSLVDLSSCRDDATIRWTK